MKGERRVAILPTIVFQRRTERLDWRKIASLDIEKCIQDGDIDQLEELLNPILFCKAESEFDVDRTDPGFIKVFRLSQLIGEYLIFSHQKDKDKLINCERKCIQLEEENGKIVQEIGILKETLSVAKKELKRRKELLASTQNEVLGSNNQDEFDQCPYCPKRFLTPFYLHAHMQRRHQGLSLPPFFQTHHHHAGQIFPLSNPNLQRVTFSQKIGDVESEPDGTPKHSDNELNKKYTFDSKNGKTSETRSQKDLVKKIPVMNEMDTQTELDASSTIGFEEMAKALKDLMTDRRFANDRNPNDDKILSSPIQQSTDQFTQTHLQEEKHFHSLTKSQTAFSEEFEGEMPLSTKNIRSSPNRNNPFSDTQPGVSSRISLISLPDAYAKSSSTTAVEEDVEEKVIRLKNEFETQWTHLSQKVNDSGIEELKGAFLTEIKKVQEIIQQSPRPKNLTLTTKTGVTTGGGVNTGSFRSTAIASALRKKPQIEEEGEVKDFNSSSAADVECGGGGDWDSLVESEPDGTPKHSQNELNMKKKYIFDSKDGKTSEPKGQKDVVQKIPVMNEMDTQTEDQLDINLVASSTTGFEEMAKALKDLMADRRLLNDRNQNDDKILSSPIQQSTDQYTQTHLQEEKHFHRLTKSQTAFSAKQFRGGENNCNNKIENPRSEIPFSTKSLNRNPFSHTQPGVSSSVSLISSPKSSNSSTTVEDEEVGKNVIRLKDEFQTQRTHLSQKVNDSGIEERKGGFLTEIKKVQEQITQQSPRTQKLTTKITTVTTGTNAEKSSSRSTVASSAAPRGKPQIEEKSEVKDFNSSYSEESGGGDWDSRESGLDVSSTEHSMFDEPNKKKKYVFDSKNGKIIEACETRSQMDLVRERFVLDEMDEQMKQLGINPDASTIGFEEMARALKHLKADRWLTDNADVEEFESQRNSLNKEVKYEVANRSIHQKLEKYENLSSNKQNFSQLANIFNKVKKSGTSWKKKVASAIKRKRKSPTHHQLVKSSDTDIKTTFFSKFARKKSNQLDDHSKKAKVTEQDAPSSEEDTSEDDESSVDIEMPPFMSRSKPILRSEYEKKVDEKKYRHGNYSSDDIIETPIKSYKEEKGLRGQRLPFPKSPRSAISSNSSSSCDTSKWETEDEEDEETSAQQHNEIQETDEEESSSRSHQIERKLSAVQKNSFVNNSNNRNSRANEHTKNDLPQMVQQKQSQNQIHHYQGSNYNGSSSWTEEQEVEFPLANSRKLTPTTTTLTPTPKSTMYKGKSGKKSQLENSWDSD